MTDDTLEARVCEAFRAKELPKCNGHVVGGVEIRPNDQFNWPCDFCLEERVLTFTRKEIAQELREASAEILKDRSSTALSKEGRVVSVTYLTDVEEVIRARADALEKGGA